MTLLFCLTLFIWYVTVNIQNKSGVSHDQL